MMDDLRLDAAPDPDDDPRVAAVLVAVATRLGQLPDELTARRHLAAMRAATALARADADGTVDSRAETPVVLGRRLLRRSAVACVAAVIAMLVLAGGGLLPDAAQQVVADTAGLIGVTLPRPDPVSGGTLVPSDEIPVSDEVEEPTDPEDTSAGLSVDAPAKTPTAPAGGSGHGRSADARGDAPDPLWDVDPSDRGGRVRPGAQVEHPAAPGPPVVNPPARVPTPPPGGAREPGPPTDVDRPDVGHPATRADNAAERARDARRGTSPPPQSRRPR